MTDLTGLTEQSDLIDRYDPLDPETLKDPYPTYEALRALGGPVWSDRLDSWVLTSYEHCKRVLLDHENFAADWRRAGETVPDVSLSVHTFDPPEHTGIYGVLAHSLMEMASDGLAKRARAEIAARLDALPAGPVNLVTEFTEPLARWFIPQALGLPEFELDVIRPIAAAITQAMDGGLVPSARKPGVEAQGKLADLIETWVEELEPGAPLRELVDRATEAGIPRAATMNSLRTLVVNGFTAVPASLGNALHALARDPRILKEQLGDPVTLDRAPHEFFRFEAPIQGTTRLAVRDTELAGVQVLRGQGVLMMFAAANRDPAHFTEPDRIDLGRWPNHHLTFGYGAHACSGSILAHMLLREVLTVLLERGAVLRLAEPATYKKLATVRTLEILPLEITF
ncbi:cytochrome P450 [Kitasatospora gansuensis]|uniref:Cytochrome P450 n=1 Tax=Kitasatospora gansuensis TaxID=258050 RepID=A0A7W7SA93_9ACTN|nr:cytochrome P450 [Kitasatospora gansuensis]MBB4946779.1 cytochrome P450 [Kitasatospora gansuensis]